MDGTLAPFNKLLQITDEFEGAMRNNFLLSIGSGLVNISGVYLLHSGIAASMGLFYAGTAVGLGNTLLPLIRHQDTQPKKKSRTHKPTSFEKNSTYNSSLTPRRWHYGCVQQQPNMHKKNRVVV